jgi:hypothetical protein
MKNRNCTHCDRPLPHQHIGGLCPLCQEEALEKTAGSSPLHYNIEDITGILGFTNEEQARRLSRAGKIPGRVPLVREHLFFKETVDRWIANSQVLPRTPTNPLQEEAKKRCENSDHEWLLDEKFDGIAYSSEDDTMQQSEPVISPGYKRTCYFCGYSMFVASLYNF